MNQKKTCPSALMLQVVRHKFESESSCCWSQCIISVDMHEGPTSIMHQNESYEANQ